MALPANEKKFPVSTPYGVKGKRWVGGVHKGVDQKCPNGTALRSPVSGTVVGVGSVWGGAFGRHQVVIEFIAKRAVDPKPRKYWVIIAHMESSSVKVGQKVNIGTAIGKSGHSGNVTGPHVHMEVQLQRFWGARNHVNPQFVIDMKKV